MTIHTSPANMGTPSARAAHSLIRHMPERVRRIVLDTCHKHSVPVWQLMSDDRSDCVVMARREAMWLAKAGRPMTSASQIGRWFRRDHTTVLYAIACYQRDHGGARLTRFKVEGKRR